VEEPESPGHLLTTSQVADRFQVTTWTVRKWVRDGKVPALKLSGKYVRFRPEDVERIVAEGVPDKDQIGEAIARRTTAAQGLPLKVDDQRTVGTLAEMFGPPDPQSGSGRKAGSDG
jgi:excisionase family DNA binding protein